MAGAAAATGKVVFTIRLGTASLDDSIITRQQPLLPRCNCLCEPNANHTSTRTSPLFISRIA